MKSSPAEGAPFVKILPLVVVAVVVSPLLRIGIVWLTALWAVVTASALLLHRYRWGGVLAALAVMMTAIIVVDLRHSGSVPPLDRQIEMVVTVNDTQPTGGKWLRSTAELERFRTPESDWQPSLKLLVLYADTAAGIEIGGRYDFCGRILPLSREGLYEGYARLMHHRGYVGSCFVNADGTTEVLAPDLRGLVVAARKTQHAAAKRFDQLNMPADCAAVAKAMTLGLRSSIDQQLKEGYARSGTAHLLAVSGLHVGIVVMLLNALLYLLPALGRNGHIIKNIIVIVVIWLYALLTGLSPSVVRAAVMFTALQVGLATGGYRSATNILFAAASIMLLLNPDYLYDISFQLSFLAVAGIAVGFGPLMHLVESRSRLLNLFWGVFIVGLCSTLATAPLTACQFGRISLPGIFINPVVIVLANIVVLLSLVWIALPIASLGGLFGKAIALTAGAQNKIVEWTGAQSWASWQIELPVWATITFYAAATIAIIALYSLKRREKDWKLMR